jgi:hypothetical protein
VLAVLKYDGAANFQLAADRPQAHSIAADVESMDQFGIGFARNVIPGNSDGQYCPGPVNLSLIVERRTCVRRQSFQSFIRGVQSHFLYLNLR